MRRRGFVAGAAITASSVVARASVDLGGPPPPFVLVHGAWHGGWCWRRLVAPLAAAGHAVHAPTLTGLGERLHLARPDTDLETHVRDLEAVFAMEDLSDAVLVGHSYAGFPISLLAERLEPGRLRGLVYLDAFVPEDGTSVLDHIDPPERRAALREAGRAGGFVPPLPLAAFGVTRAEDVAWAQPRLAPQPFATFAQPARLTRPAGEGLARAYIACTQPASGSFGKFAAGFRGDPSWWSRELRTGHNAMMTDPAALAALLVEFATG